MVEILLGDFLVLRDVFNCKNIPPTLFELSYVLWKEINSARHFFPRHGNCTATAASIPRNAASVPRTTAAVAAFSPGPLVLIFEREFKSTDCITMFLQFIDFRLQDLQLHGLKYLTSMPTRLKHLI
jgi:hypothetical protein